MSDTLFELTPAELPQSISPEKIEFGINKLAQSFELNGKRFVLKWSQGTSWNDYRNSRELEKKYPGVYKGRPAREVEMEEAKKEKDEYKEFCIGFGSEGVAKTIVVVGNHFDSKIDSNSGSTSEMSVEEKDFIGVHIYQEQTSKMLRDALGINVKKMAIEQYERLITVKFEELKNGIPFEKNLKDLITEHRQALCNFYDQCAEAALCGLVPDLHEKEFYDQKGEQKGYRTFGYLFTSGVGLDKDGNIKWYDFGNPHIKLFSLNEMKIIRKTIDEHKAQNEFAIRHDSNSDTILSDWYITLIRSFANNNTYKYLAEIMKLFEPNTKNGPPYLESMRQLIGAQRYGGVKNENL